MILEAKVQNPGVGGTMLPLKPLEEDPSCLFQPWGPPRYGPPVPASPPCGGPLPFNEEARPVQYVPS